VKHVKSSLAASQKIPSKASPCLPWPPPEPGVRISVCESPLASYSIGIGLSRWNLVDPRPWIYFRPERRERNRAFGDLCGATEKLALFRGFDDAARIQAQGIFKRLCVALLKLAEKESGDAS
jgi:hypothetical protein